MADGLLMVAGFPLADDEKALNGSAATDLSSSCVYDYTVHKLDVNSL